MSHFTRENLDALAVTASTAAQYLDACDHKASVRLDPTYYQACGEVLTAIFAMVNAEYAFPDLLRHSPAAREIADGIAMGRRIDTSRLVFYPQLAALIGRISG